MADGQATLQSFVAPNTEDQGQHFILQDRVAGSCASAHFECPALFGGMLAD